MPEDITFTVDMIRQDLWDRIAGTCVVPLHIKAVTLPTRDGGQLLVDKLEPGIPQRVLVNGTPVTVVRARID